MLRILINALLKDLQALIRHDVFALSGDSRNKKITEVLGQKYPKAFQTYFADVKTEDLYKDSARLIKFLSSGRFSSTDFPLLKTLRSFIVRDLTASQPTDERTSALIEAIRALADENEQELESAILKSVARFPDVSRIRVQTALPLSNEEKNKMRDHFNQDDQTCHLTFVVDSSLLGGMRIFKDGTLFDVSWARRIGSPANLP